MRRILCLALAVLCLGCTSVISTKVAGNSTNEGFIYSLKKVGFLGNATYVLRSCGNPANVDVTVDFSPMYLADKTTEYVINYDKLNRMNKNIDMNLNYDGSGSIASINFAEEDKTLEIAAKAIVAAGKIAVAIAIKSRSDNVCTRETNDILIGMENTKKRIRDESKMLADVESQTAALKLTLTKLQSNSKEYVQTQNSLDLLEKTSKYYADTIDKNKKSLAAAVDQTTMVQRIYFGFADKETEKCWPPDDINSKQWFNSSYAPSGKDYVVCAKLEPIGTPGKNTFSSPTEGVYYRQPGLGLLSVCGGGVCMWGNPPEGGKLLYLKYVDVPQFGTVAVLPFRNNVGGNDQLNVTFSTSGGLQTARFSNKAADEKIGTLLDQATSNVVPVIGAAKNQALERTKAQTDLLKAQTDKLKAEKALKDAEADLKKDGN